MNVSQVIDSAKHLNFNERALVAHCLISSLETKQDEDVEQKWLELVEKRYQDLISGKAESISWQDIKKEVEG